MAGKVNGIAALDTTTPQRDFTENEVTLYKANVIPIVPDLVEEITMAVEANKSIIKKQAQMLGEVSGEFLLTLRAESVPTFLDPIMPRVGNIALAGGSDTGKSCFLRQLAIECVAGQTSFLGFNFHARFRSVIFVSSEDDQNATSFLIGRQALDYTPDQLKNLRFIFEIDNIYVRLDESLTANPADLIIIDCFADVYAGDLKDTQKIRTFLHQFQELAVKHQCLILWLHHTAKRTENFEPSKNNLLSGQGFEAKMRMVMELRQDYSDSSLRHLCIVKGNYLSASCKNESFVLRFNEKTFRFGITGERTDFSLLAKPQIDPNKEKIEQAKSLKEQGLTYDQIAEKLGISSKGTISKWFKKDGFQQVSNGNDMETNGKRA